MLKRVRITALPKARTGYQVQGALVNDVPAMGGKDYNAYIGMKKPQVRDSLTAVPREEANLEAEGGETVMGNIDGSGMPSFFDIKGPRHHSGGVPLSLPDDSFIFSDTQSMKIADPVILKMFNKPVKKGGYTPAELSKPFDVNKYRKILQDPDSDKIAKKTAELMIKNYTIKLGALALAQEAKKGFPQGIPAIAQPYMEANGITEEQVMPELAVQKRQQEQQMMMMQQQQAAGQEPYIEPEQQEQMATMDPGMSPDQMMMAPEGQPMAMNGMQIGNYSRPMFYDSPSMMNAGGIPRAPKMVYQDGGELTKDNLTAEDKKAIEEKWAGKTDDYIAFMNTKKALTSNPELLNDMYEQYKKDIQAKESYTQGKYNEQLYTGFKPQLEKMSKDDMLRELLAQEERNARLAAYGFDPLKSDQRISKTNRSSRTNQQALDIIEKTPGLKDLDFTGGYKGQAAYIAYRNLLNTDKYKSHGQFQTGVGDETVGGIKGTVTGIDNANTNTTLGQRLNYKSPTAPAPAKRCECTDPKTMEKYTVGKDEKGNCLPCTKTIKRCECTRMDGSVYDPGTKADGTCNECEDATEAQAPAPPKPEAQWWLQDTVNTMGAFGDLMRAKKYMPWESRVDLEEPRPTFLDPTRELAAQSEQANIAAQAAAQFAGPQALNARLAQIQGQGARGAADALSRVNNANVNIANQFEANRTGVRNQESMLNQQMANRVYDKNVIANQQFDNTIAQGRANLRNAYNTAVTNKWKTDALNQLYPNYQTLPGIGGRVVYTPTDKKVDPGVRERTQGEQLKEWISQGIDPKTANQMLLEQYKSGLRTGKKGGSMPGYVYTSWPIFL